MLQKLYKKNENLKLCTNVINTVALKFCADIFKVGLSYDGDSVCKLTRRSE